nr:lysophospholipase [Prevotella sp.]
MNRRIIVWIVGTVVFLLALVLVLLLTASTAKAQNLQGSFSGKLNAGMAKLTIVLNIETDGTATLESPDQTDQKIPATIDYLSADSVAVSVSMLQASYQGRMVGEELQGTFKQAGFSFPLNMKAGKVERRRSQVIEDTSSYQTEEVAFRNDKDGATLAGTLSIPSSLGETGACPCLLMVSGSGQQNRDEELLGHKPFAVIADYLARNGIATLRYDDRATGQSVGGDVANATSVDFARDAAAGIDFLRKDKRFSKVGVIGHSEGGLIAFMLGAQKKVDFIVSLAGPGVSGDTILLKQMQAGNADATGEKLTMAKVRETILAQNNPWLNYFIDYDPSDNIRHTKCPVLAVNGSKDIQVDAEINLGALRRLLPKNKKNCIKAYDGLNHLFQHCTTGMPDEYAAI